jgi:capsular exopolysaccharide synthesis family protein
MPPDSIVTDREDSPYPENSNPLRNYPQESPLKALILSMLKRPWIIVFCLLVISIPALYYIYSQPPRFRSSAVVSTGSQTTASEIGMMASRYYGMTNVNDQEVWYTSILGSGGFFRDVSNRIIQQRPEFADMRDSVMSLVRNSISYARKSKTEGFLEITAEGNTPEFTLLLASSAVDGFKQISIELRRQESITVTNFIENQLNELNRDLGNIEAQIQLFLQTRKISIDDLSTGIDASLRDLEKNLTVAQTQRDIARRQIDSYTSRINNRTNSFLSRSTDPEANERMLSMRTRLEQINSMNGDSISLKDPTAFSRLQREKMQILSNILKSTTDAGDNSSGTTADGRISMKTLDDALETCFVQFETAQIQYDYYQEQIDKFHRDHPDLPTDILEFLNISRTKDVLLKTTDILVQWREQKKIEMASETGGITVIDTPELPDRPVSQRRLLKSLFTLLMAGFIGSVISYLIDRLDNTIQGEVEIQQRFGLPVYGSVPVLDMRLGSHRKSGAEKKTKVRVSPKANGYDDLKLLNHHSESSPIAEAYRSIKTGILFSIRDRGKNVFIVSSPVAGDGKSLTTYNLGVSTAHGGIRVLIIDADLRRASQHKLFGLERTPGLTDYLHGKAQLNDVIVASSTPNLFLLPSGMKVANPAELVSSHLMQQLIDELSKSYDLVLIDTPPITPCMDSRQLALMAGGMILVVRAEGTKINDIEHSLDLCSRFRVEMLGVIVNHAAFRYGYGYYYIYQRYNTYGSYYNRYQYYYSQDPETKELMRRKKERAQKNETDRTS